MPGEGLLLGRGEGLLLGVRCPTAGGNTAGGSTSLDCLSFIVQSISTDLPQSITSLPHALTSLPQSITSLPDTLTSLSQSITSLPHTLTSLSQSITSLPDTLTSLPESISSLPHTLTSLPSTTSSPKSKYISVSKEDTADGSKSLQAVAKIHDASPEVSDRVSLNFSSRNNELQPVDEFPGASLRLAKSFGIFRNRSKTGRDLVSVLNRSENLTYSHGNGSLYCSQENLSNNGREFIGSPLHNNMSLVHDIYKDSTPATQINENLFNDNNLLSYTKIGESLLQNSCRDLVSSLHGSDNLASLSRELPHGLLCSAKEFEPFSGNMNTNDLTALLRIRNLGNSLSVQSEQGT